jgi:hypothetical protein
MSIPERIPDRAYRRILPPTELTAEPIHIFDSTPDYSYRPTQVPLPVPARSARHSSQRSSRHDTVQMASESRRRTQLSGKPPSLPPVSIRATKEQ